MTDPGSSNTTEKVLKDLTECVASLKDDVNELKKMNGATTSKESRKRPRDGNAGAEDREVIPCDGEDDPTQQYCGDEGSDSNPAGSTDREEHKPSGVDRFPVSEEGKAFLETAFTSRLKYTTRKAKVARYGQPDTKWAMRPELRLVAEGILSNKALRQDKDTYRSQEMWLEPYLCLPGEGPRGDSDITRGYPNVTDLLGADGRCFTAPILNEKESPIAALQPPFEEVDGREGLCQSPALPFWGRLWTKSQRKTRCC